MSSALVVLVFKRVLRISNVPTFLKSKVKKRVHVPDPFPRSTFAPAPSRNELEVLSNKRENEKRRFYFQAKSFTRRKPVHDDSALPVHTINHVPVRPRNETEQIAFGQAVVKRFWEHRLKEEKRWNSVAIEMENRDRRRKGRNLQSGRGREKAPSLKQMIQRVIKSIGFKEKEDQ